MDKKFRLGLLGAFTIALALVGVFGLTRNQASAASSILEVVVLPQHSAPGGTCSATASGGTNLVGFTSPVPNAGGLPNSGIFLNNTTVTNSLGTTATIQETLLGQALVEVPAGGSIFLCTDSSQPTLDVTYDSHGAGAVKLASCDDPDANGIPGEYPADSCQNVTGESTSQLEIPGQTTVFATSTPGISGTPPAGLATVAVGVASGGNNTALTLVQFTCPTSFPLFNALPFTVTQGANTPGATVNVFQFLIQCKGSASTIVSLTATPTTVEIVPAPSNTSSSLIQLTVTDSNGNPVFPGQVVDWTTDRCAISGGPNALTGLVTSLPSTLGGIDLTGGTGLGPGFSDVTRANLATLVNNLNTANPASFATWETAENLMFVRGAVGTAVQTVLYDSGFSLSTGLPAVSRTAVILGCNPGEVGSNPTPGVATVTAIVETNGLLSGALVGAVDLVKTVQVTVVGPPASITVSASPNSLRCGEKSTITVTVKDSIGQNVSDHTVVELVTNVGGTIGGTGAVAGFGGPVVPISSSVAGTFGGVATAFLLTSEVTSGPYEVVATSGGTAPGVADGLFSTNLAQQGSLISPLNSNGVLVPTIDLNQAVATPLGGIFSTPPVSAQTTVNCSIPTVAAPAVAAPEVQAPRTGTGITPPNTGDAGLAATSTSGSSWALFALIGGVAFALAGFATLKFARR